MSADLRLIEFIREARRRGFLEEAIIKSLLDEGWSDRDIDQALDALDERSASNRITITLDRHVLGALKKRAKRNLLSLEQQVQDIIRRSMVNTRPTVKAEKLDDLLVSIFSRRSRTKAR